MLAGSFATMPFADLLQWLSDARRSGILQVALEFEERYLRLDEGAIVAYGSDDPLARDLGRLCLRRGLCSEAALLAAVAQQRESHMPLGDVLVASGAVTAEALDELVRAHVEEMVIGLFLWPGGRFVYRDEVAPADVEPYMPPELELAQPIPSRHLLMEGMRRLDEWGRIVKVLPSDEVQLHALGAAPELPILDEIAKRHAPPTLGELLAEKGDSRFAVCEQLFRAYERGLVAVEAPGVDARCPSAPRPGATSVAQLVQAAETMLQEGQHDEAAALLRAALALDPFRDDARALLGNSRAAQLEALYQAMPREAIFRVVAADEALRRAPLSERERRVLAKINGRWDVAALAQSSGVGELETLRALRRLLHSNLVCMTGA